MVVLPNILVAQLKDLMTFIYTGEVGGKLRGRNVAATAKGLAKEPQHDVDLQLRNVLIFFLNIKDICFSDTKKY